MKSSTKYKNENYSCLGYPMWYRLLKVFPPVNASRKGSTYATLGGMTYVSWGSFFRQVELLILPPDYTGRGRVF